MNTWTNVREKSGRLTLNAMERTSAVDVYPESVLANSMTIPYA